MPPAIVHQRNHPQQVRLIYQKDKKCWARQIIDLTNELLCVSGLFTSRTLTQDHAGSDLRLAVSLVVL